MELNIDKSNARIFNFTNNYQFTTSFSHNGGQIDPIEDTKLLGTIITSNLKWAKTTAFLSQKANATMRLLHKLSEFSPPIDLVTIYTSYFRSIMMQSCIVWPTGLTQDDSADLASLKHP